MPICSGVACSSSAAVSGQREIGDLRAERRDRQRQPQPAEIRRRATGRGNCGGRNARTVRALSCFFSGRAKCAATDVDDRRKFGAGRFPVVGVRRSRRTSARELLQDVQAGASDACARHPVDRPDARGAHEGARRTAAADRKQRRFMARAGTANGTSWLRFYGRDIALRQCERRSRGAANRDLSHSPHRNPASDDRSRAPISTYYSSDPDCGCRVSARRGAPCRCR